MFNLKIERTGFTQNYPLLKVLGYYMFNMIISCPFPKNYPSFKRPFKSFVHYENPTGSRALGKDEGCQKGGKKPSQNLGLAKSSFFPSPKGTRNVQIHWRTSMITYQLADNPHLSGPDLWE